MAEHALHQITIQQNGLEAVVEILPAGWRDALAVYSLEKVCFPQDAWPVFDVVAALTVPGIVRLKAQIANALVGFAMADIKPFQDIAWISTIGVDPAYRNVGIGAALLDQCEMKANTERIRLCVRPSNQIAIGLYKKHGYRSIGNWPEYYKGGEDALVMEKVLK